MNKPTLRTINNGFSAVIIALALYMIAAPFWPQFTFFWKDKFGNSTVPYEGVLGKSLGKSANSSETPKDNRLVIPQIGVNTSINEGGDISVIDSGGSWRRPQTATPGQAGNTVVVGHRFYYGSSATFYHLDKLKTGDIFAVYWEGKELLYVVSETKVVTPFDTVIEAPTSAEQLTLYTCTPLWTSANRLVIVAKPVKETP